jgi:hypothetical protein
MAASFLTFTFRGICLKAVHYSLIFILWATIRLTHSQPITL